MTSMHPYFGEAYAANRLAEALCDACQARLVREARAGKPGLLRRLTRRSAADAADPSTYPGCGCARGG